MTTQPATGNNRSIDAIVNAYLRVPETSSNELDKLAEDLVKLILQVFSNQFNNNSPLIPYKDITDVMFKTTKTVHSDSINNFYQNIENQAEGLEESKKEKILYFHSKLVEHILLAQAQRDFIQESIIVAKETAQKAEQIAGKAENTAKKAEGIYESIFANYITILGIFAAIIISVFGGLNIVKSIVISQLEWPEIIRISSLIMICEITILYFLTKMIKALTQKELNIEREFFSIIIVFILIILLSYYSPIISFLNK